MGYYICILWHTSPSKIALMTEPRRSSSTTTYPSFLERGKACVDCRRRKVKCDGGWPACGRCVHAGHGEDCEYLDEQGQTRTQILEQSIARLEARIRELERPDASASAVALHEPHLYGQASSSSLSSQSSSHASINRSSMPFSRAGSQVASSPSENFALPHRWWDSATPPFNVSQMLINFFVPSATQFGFFLNMPRFLASISPSDPRLHLVRPSPALLSAVHLFGIHLSGLQALTSHESVFVTRAVHDVSSFHAPHQVIHSIQAEVLLAHYFLRNGRFLEAMHRINSAVSLSIGCGLHKPRRSTTNSDVAFALAPPRDAIEDGERIDGFWTILILHKCWGVSLQWPSTISYVLDEQINIPWPFETFEYESGQIPFHLQRRWTWKMFLDDPTATNVAVASSTLALHVKAATLFERASYLGVQWKSDLTDSDERVQVLTVDRGLLQFINVFSSFENSSATAIDTVRRRLVTYTIAQVAMIQLHSAYAENNAASSRKCLEAAKAVAVAIENIPNIAEWKFINPIMGTMWVAVCRVFIRAISSIKTPHSASPGWSSSVSKALYRPLMAALSRVMTTMSIFGSTCPLIGFQLTRVQEAYAAI